MVRLLPIVEQLAGKNDARRSFIIYEYLQSLGLKPQFQNFGTGNYSNMVVDFPGPDPARKKVLLTSHYDAVPGSPGANDDASAVAVLLGVAALYYTKAAPVPVRLIFFDGEEAGLLGSKAYVQQQGIEDVAAVLNMELVGEGSIPAFWPHTRQSEHYHALLRESSPDAHFLRYAPGHSGDHQPFLDAGVHDSICLSLVCERDRGDLQDIIRRLERPTMLDPFIIMTKINSSKTFKHYHERSDTITHIRENSLQQALGIARKVIENYDGQS